MKKYILNLLFLAFLISLNGCSNDAEENIIQPNSDGLVPVNIHVSGIMSGNSAATRMDGARPKVTTIQKKDSIIKGRMTLANEARTRGTQPMTPGVEYSAFFFDANAGSDTYNKCIAYK
jgi:hypothetical protein